MGDDVKDKTEEEVLTILEACVRQFHQHRRQQLATLRMQRSLLRREREESESNDKYIGKRTREVKPRPDCSSSTWGEFLQDESLDEPTSTAAKLFRRRFRVPYVFFQHLVELAKDGKWFPCVETDVAGRRCIPVELKACGLTYVAEG